VQSGGVGWDVGGLHLVCGCSLVVGGLVVGGGGGVWGFVGWVGGRWGGGGGGGGGGSFCVFCGVQGGWVVCFAFPFLCDSQ